MRVVAAAKLTLPLALLLAVGCTAGEPAVGELPVTVPPPPATAAAPPPPATAPPTSAPTPGLTSRPPVDEPLTAYRALATDWQRARSAFFTEVSSGRRHTLAEQHALAATYLAAMRRFAAGVRARGWPAAARPAAAELLAVSARQQGHLVAMTRAPYPSAFTERLGDYGVDAARENRAVAGVERALGG